MRFASKREFVESVEKEHLVLIELVESLPKSRLHEPDVWGNGWTILDLLAHLSEWEQMFLGWYRAGLEGKPPILPAQGFKWNETPRLNQAIWKKHHLKSAGKVREAFDSSYQEVLLLIRNFSEEELLAPGHFAWTGKYPLTTYLGPNTCSHYRFAIKILKRWQKSGAQNKRIFIA